MMAVTVWLARWSRQSEQEQSRSRYVGILVLLTVSALVVSLLRSALTFTSLVKVRKCNKLALCTHDLLLFKSVAGSVDNDSLKSNKTRVPYFQ